MIIVRGEQVMRRSTRWVVAGLGTLGCISMSWGQTPSPTTKATNVVAPAPFSMPGTQVGTPLVTPAGQSLPKAAPAAGAQVGTGPGGIPGALDPRSPKPAGQEIDLKNVIAPYPGMPKPAPSFWDQLQERWFKMFMSDQPVTPPQNITPGIYRRNRERARERMWRWD